LIWKTGPDTSFWFSCVIFLIMGAVTVWAYRSLATVAKEHRNPPGESEIYEV
jgi:hypothetical protein